MGLGRKVGKTGRKINPRNAETVTYTAGETIRKNAFVESYQSTTVASSASTSQTLSGTIEVPSVQPVNDTYVLEAIDCSLYLINVAGKTPQITSIVSIGEYELVLIKVNEAYYILQEENAYGNEYKIVKIDGTEITVGDGVHVSSSEYRIDFGFATDGKTLVINSDGDATAYNINRATLELERLSKLSNVFDEGTMAYYRGAYLVVDHWNDGWAVSVSNGVITQINRNYPIDTNSYDAEETRLKTVVGVNYIVSSQDTEEFSLVSVRTISSSKITINDSITLQNWESATHYTSARQVNELGSNSTYIYAADAASVHIINKDFSSVSSFAHNSGVTASQVNSVACAATDDFLYVSLSTDEPKLKRMLFRFETRLRESQSSILGIAQNAANAGEEVEVWQ